MKNILGISAFYHDSSASIVINGKIIAAVQEERFTREKHTSDFPVESIKYCLEESGLEINDLDAIVFYDKPLLKFERLLETYYAFAPKGFLSFVKSIPVWLKEKLFLKKMIYDGLKKVSEYDKKSFKLLFTEHHYAHAASTFFSSSHEKSAILTIDGVGEWCTASIGIGDKNELKLLKEMNFPHSVGLLYSAFTYYLGFTVNSGEYKLMGLAPYGNSESEITQKFVAIIKDKLVKINHDGSIWMDQSYYNYATGLKMVKDSKWEKLFGFPRRKEDSTIEQHHCDLANAIQQITEEIILKMAIEAKRITGSNNLCLAGGVALNCVANGKLIQQNIFKNIYITPASGDAGGSLGAALGVYYSYYKNERIIDENDSINGAYLGPEYSDKEIESMSKKVKGIHTKHNDINDLTDFISTEITKGKVVGWFQGRMEFGPRSLGNRSILGDARNPEMQKKINLKIKYREGFRPFAPSVLVEDCQEYFDLSIPSPYMLLVAPVRLEKRIPLPTNYNEFKILDRLYYKRSDIPSVTHLDFSARIQTVSKKTNPRYWELINSFKRKTGYGLLINTSFNVRGEPIVCTPYDAFRCFMSTEMDLLVINDYVFEKNKQLDHQNISKWMVKYKMD